MFYIIELIKLRICSCRLWWSAFVITNSITDPWEFSFILYRKIKTLTNSLFLRDLWNWKKKSCSTLTTMTTKLTEDLETICKISMTNRRKKKHTILLAYVCNDYCCRKHRQINLLFSVSLFAVYALSGIDSLQ